MTTAFRVDRSRILTSALTRGRGETLIHPFKESGFSAEGGQGGQVVERTIYESTMMRAVEGYERETKTHTCHCRRGTRLRPGGCQLTCSPRFHSLLRPFVSTSFVSIASKLTIRAFLGSTFSRTGIPRIKWRGVVGTSPCLDRPAPSHFMRSPHSEPSKSNPLPYQSSLFHQPSEPQAMIEPCLPWTMKPKDQLA